MYNVNYNGRMSNEMSNSFYCCIQPKGLLYDAERDLLSKAKFFCTVIYNQVYISDNAVLIPYRLYCMLCFLASVPVAVSPSLILLHASVSCVRSVTWLWHVAGSGNALVLSCRARSSGGFYCDPDDCGIGAISTCKAHPSDSHKHSGSLRSFHSAHVILPLPGDNQRV